MEQLVLDHEPVAASPAAMSEADFVNSGNAGDTTPRPSDAHTMSHQDAGQSNASKRKFGTVETERPTPAKKRTIGFVEGHYGGVRDRETTKQRISRVGRLAVAKYDYKACPLPENHIRLLVLQPNPDPNADIVVELQSFSIPDLFEHSQDYPYTALSYNWGDDKDEKTVWVDMFPSEPLDIPKISMDVGDVVSQVKRRMKRLTVKPNLYAFLQEFRSPTNCLLLWVDRICIDQSNSVERSDQVGKMSIIYSLAKNVSIWLGPADRDRKSDRAMDFISSMLEGDSRLKLTERYAEQWAELLLLMRRRWFSRRWIIQELALAKSAEVRCGSKKKHWRDFADAVSVFALYFDTILGIIKSQRGLEKSFEGIKDMKPLGARILVDILANTFQRRPDGTIFSPRLGLESLISSLYTFETADPRDTVYTLLNIAKETFHLPYGDSTENVRAAERRRKRHEKNPPLVPDYKLDLLEVYTKFVKWCIQESGSLDILCRHWALPELKQVLDDYYPKLVELPSWIKTVIDSAFGSQKEGFGGRRTGDSFVGTPENRNYNASRGKEPVVSFGRDQILLEGPNQPTKHEHSGGPYVNGTFPHTPSRQRPVPRRKVPRDRPKLDLRNVLTVKGVFIGHVTKATAMLEGVIPKRVLQDLGHKTPSTELTEVSDSVWRTLVADRDPYGSMPPAWYHRACITNLVAATGAGHMDTNAILQDNDTAVLQADYIKRVQAVCWNRSFIECNHGSDVSVDQETASDSQESVSPLKRLVGIGPGDTQEHDIVVIMFGCSVPCVLRALPYSESQCYYKLVGEAFVLGQMDGEAISDLSEEDLAGEDFKLI